jgi:hypothetical protein
MKVRGNRDYCIRFPPSKKNKFPIVDPYYTECGEFEYNGKEESR